MAKVIVNVAGRRLIARLVLIFALIFTLASLGCSDALLVEIQRLTVWDPTITYDKGEYAKDDPLVYQSLSDANQGHQPSVSPTWWRPE